MTPLLVAAFVSGLLVAPLPPEKTEPPPPQWSERNLSVSFLAPSENRSPFGNFLAPPPFVQRADGLGANVTLVQRSGSSWNCGMPVVPGRPGIDPKIAKPAPMKGHVRAVAPAACGK